MATSARAKYCTRSCRDAANRKLRLTTREENRRTYLRKDRALRLARSNARRAVAVQIARDIKMKLGCVDCGYKAHPAALQFDHLGKKYRNVSSIVTISRLLAEIEKCEVVCANCHAIRTHQRHKLTSPAHEDLLNYVLANVSRETE
jgi:hypothetical protein